MCVYLQQPIIDQRGDHIGLHVACTLGAKESFEHMHREVVFIKFILNALLNFFEECVAKKEGGRVCSFIVWLTDRQNLLYVATITTVLISYRYSSKVISGYQWLFSGMY